MDIVAILKECIEVSKRNPSLFIPTLAVGIVSFLLTLIFLGGGAATMVVTRGNVSPSALGALLGSTALILTVTAMLGLIASAMAIGMAGEALAMGATSLDTGLNAVKQTLVPVITASILLCLIIGVGFMLIIPGLVAVFFLLFTLPAVVLDRYGAVAAIKKSIVIVKSNVSDVVVLFVAILIIWIAFTIAQVILNFIPFLGPLISALLWGIFSGYINVVTVRFYRNCVPAG